ncbi:M10 family metallopeptidase C-terminal domain-containing protein [Bradyrhizobium sp. TZ2]
MIAGAGADIVYGDAGADRIFETAATIRSRLAQETDTVFGGAGDDLFVAENGDGNDVYFGHDNGGGPGSDTLDMSAVSANVTVNLGSGPLLNGTASSSQTGNDTIWGIENVNTGPGNDTITASNAVNVMNGGGGNDTFKFTSASAADGDTILAFGAGDHVDLDGDRCQLGYCWRSELPLVSGAFTAAGQLAVTYETRADGDFTVVQGNIDGNADADFTLEIAGHQNLTNANLGL